MQKLQTRKFKRNFVNKKLNKKATTFSTYIDTDGHIACIRVLDGDSQENADAKVKAIVAMYNSLELVSASI